jgi:hypothetical protein
MDVIVGSGVARWNVPKDGGSSGRRMRRIPFHDATEVTAGPQSATWRCAKCALAEPRPGT